jgi:hypothetical protein
MIWNSKKIESLVNQIGQGVGLKSIIRNIQIDLVLDKKENLKPTFPFYIDNKGCVFLFKRAPYLNFEMTHHEKKTFKKFKENPYEFFTFLFTGYEFEFVKVKGCGLDRKSMTEALEVNILEKIKDFYSSKNNEYYIKSDNPHLTIFYLFYIITFIKNKKIILDYDNFYPLTFSKIYKDLPFYLKPGVLEYDYMNHKYRFENETEIIIKEWRLSKSPNDI